MSHPISEVKPKVVVTHWVHPEVEKYLRQFCEPVLNETRETLPREEVLRRARDAEGIMVFMPDSVDEAFLEQCPSLRVVAGALKGYDNFDVEACTRRGIVFTIVPDLLTVPTAELAVALLLGIARNCLPGDTMIRSGEFAGWRPVLYGTGLEGATVGIVGFGAVGQAFAKRLRGFDARVIATDTARIPQAIQRELEVEMVDFDSLLSESDAVVLFLPLEEDTRHFFSRDTLATMRPGSLLVNVSRGSVVDEGAVADALAEGPLAAYAADVFEMEDWALVDRPRNIDERLLENPSQTFFTPHLGSAVDEVRKMIALEAGLHLEQVLSGGLPAQAINAKSLAAPAP